MNLKGYMDRCLIGYIDGYPLFRLPKCRTEQEAEQEEWMWEQCILRTATDIGPSFVRELTERERCNEMKAILGDATHAIVGALPDGHCRGYISYSRSEEEEPGPEIVLTFNWNTGVIEER